MHFNIFTIIALIIFGSTIYCNVKAQLIVQRIMKKVDIPGQWNGMISLKRLKQLHLVIDDKIVLKEVASALFLLRLNLYVVWGGGLLFVILMFIL